MKKEQFTISKEQFNYEAVLHFTGKPKFFTLNTEFQSSEFLAICNALDCLNAIDGADDIHYRRKGTKKWRILFKCETDADEFKNMKYYINKVQLCLADNRMPMTYDEWNGILKKNTPAQLTANISS